MIPNWLHQMVFLSMCLPGSRTDRALKICLPQSRMSYFGWLSFTISFKGKFNSMPFFSILSDHEKSEFADQSKNMTFK